MTALLPISVQTGVEDALGCRVTNAAALSGGDVNRAAKVETETGAFTVVKWHETAPPNAFLCEADGLQQIGETGAVRVLRVLAASENPAFLVLEWIEPARQTSDFSETFAVALAQMHRKTARKNEPFGYRVNNYLGSQPQTNKPRTTDWAAFYRDYRLIPQIERARAKGLIREKRGKLLDGVLAQLPRLLAEMPREASLLHGDLWSGNFLCGLNAKGEGEPVLIDPAVYCGPREMEMAYVELFGGFPPGFMAHYNAAFPLDGGYAARRPLHQLYPLLIHLNHFGEGYGPRVDAACRACLSALKPATR